MHKWSYMSHVGKGQTRDVQGAVDFVQGGGGGGTEHLRDGYLEKL